MRFVHCSDIHQGQRPGLLELFNKRLSGTANQLLRRRGRYRAALFERLLAKVCDPELKVDRLVITGDLSNLALEREFAAVAAMLEPVELPITVIPGNHDAYVKSAHKLRRFEHYFGKYMEGQHERGFPYPFVQVHDGVAFIGVSSAVPTWWLYADGKVGRPQLDRLDRALSATEVAGLFRVVLIHHPVREDQARERHELLDADALQRILFRRGAELVLHGHEHRQQEYTVPGPGGGEITVHGISAAVSLSTEPERRASFAIYEVSPPDKKGVCKWTRELWVWDGEDFAPMPEDAGA